MASYFKRIIDHRTINGNDLMNYLEALDLGAYREIEIVITLVKAATGTGNPKIMFQHAAINEPDAYIAFNTAAEVDMINGTVVYLNTSTTPTSRAGSAGSRQVARSRLGVLSASTFSPRSRIVLSTACLVDHRQTAWIATLLYGVGLGITLNRRCTTTPKQVLEMSPRII